MSNLYLLTQDTVRGYDTFDSCVVCATTENVARRILPSDYADNTWAKPDDVKVKLIGTATGDIKEGDVICASFNAG
jgi:hypothetical protein